MSKPNRRAERFNIPPTRSERGLATPTIDSLATEVLQLQLLVDDLRDELQEALLTGDSRHIHKRDFGQPTLSTKFEEEAVQRDRERAFQVNDDTVQSGQTWRQGRLFS